MRPVASRSESPVPELPDGLEGRAAAVWRRVVRRHPGLASDERLRLYAEAMGRCEDAATTLRTAGPLVRSPDGTLAKSPLYDVIRDDLAMVRMLAFDLGISGLEGSEGDEAEDVVVVIEEKGAYDPARHCGGTRRSGDKPGPHLSHGKIVVREGGGKHQPCTLPKGWGTDHPGSGTCRHHFGTTPTHEAAAAQEAAAKALEKMGVPIPADPAQALLEQVWEAFGNVAFLRAQVQSLGSDVFTAAGRAIVRTYDQERDRLTRICKLALDAGVAERDIALREHQAEGIVLVVTRVLDSLELPRERRAEAQLVAVSALQELDEIEASVGRERRN